MGVWASFPPCNSLTLASLVHIEEGVHSGTPLSSQSRGHPTAPQPQRSERRHPEMGVGLSPSTVGDPDRF